MYFSSNILYDKMCYSNQPSKVLHEDVIKDSFLDISLKKL